MQHQSNSNNESYTALDNHLNGRVHTALWNLDVFKYYTLMEALFLMLKPLHLITNPIDIKCVNPVHMLLKLIFVFHLNLSD